MCKNKASSVDEVTKLDIFFKFIMLPYHTPGNIPLKNYNNVYLFFNTTSENIGQSADGAADCPPCRPCSFKQAVVSAGMAFGGHNTERDVLIKNHQGYGKMSGMIKIIYRTVLKELLIMFVLIIAFLNSILMMEKILKLTRHLAGLGTSVLDMTRLILYLQPQLLALTIPMAILLAPIIVYGRMTMDNEIIILRTSGMSFRRISSPIMAIALMGALFSIAFSFYLGPKSSVRLRNEVARMFAVKAALAVEAGTFNTSLKDLVILVRGKRDDILQDIFIFDSRSKEEPKVLMAREGRLSLQDDSTLRLSLSDGYINIIKGSGITELFFDKYQFAMPLYANTPVLRNFELTPPELLRKLKNTDDQKARIELYLELQRRFSLPAICLILVFLAPPLALMSGKSGKLLGLTLGLSVFTGYYVLQIYCESLAMRSVVPYYVGAWATPFLLSIIGIILYRRESLR